MQDLGGEVQKGPEKTEEVILTIANGVDESTRSGSSDTDGYVTINNMWVLQVEADDPKIIRHIVQGEAVSGTNQYRVKLLDSSGGEKWNIVIVVNNDDTDLASNVGSRFSKFASTGKRVDTVSPDYPIQPYAITDTYLAVGVATLNGSSDIAIGRYMSPLSVKLLRAVAKVDIGVGTYNASKNTWSNSGANKIPFTLSSVQLRGSKLKIRWYFDIDKDTFDSSVNTVKKASVTGIGTQTTKHLTYDKTIVDNLYITNDIYMTESALSGRRYDGNHLGRPRLIIGGRYENGPVTYYRIDFSGLDGGSKDFFTSDILRNHLYRFTINSVSGPGQSTDDAADQVVREDLSFSSTIEPWTTGKTETPNQQTGYYMNYGGLNGSVTSTPATGDIRIKDPEWRGRQWDNSSKNFTLLFDYDTFYGEAENYFGHWPGNDPGIYNGDLYASGNGEVDKDNSIYAALKTEGAYPKLMIASNNLTDIQGNSRFAWKTGKALTAFDMCRSYNGGEYGDWRLPRLSELALMYANRTELEALNGFEPFGENAVYWSGSEYGVGKQGKSSQAWTFRFSATDVFQQEEKSTKHLIRCVRQP